MSFICGLWLTICLLYSVCLQSPVSISFLLSICLSHFLFVSFLLSVSCLHLASSIYLSPVSFLLSVSCLHLVSSSMEIESAIYTFTYHITLCFSMGFSVTIYYVGAHILYFDDNRHHCNSWHFIFDTNSPLIDMIRIYLHSACIQIEIYYYYTIYHLNKHLLSILLNKCPSGQS